MELYEGTGCCGSGGTAVCGSGVGSSPSLADLLLAQEGEKLKGTEHKAVLICGSWHSKGRKEGNPELWSCCGKRNDWDVTNTAVSGVWSICPGPGAGQRLANLWVGALGENCQHLLCNLCRGMCPCQASAGRVLPSFMPAFCRISQRLHPPERVEQGFSVWLSQTAGFPAALCSALPQCHERQDVCGVTRALCSACSEEPVL